MILRAFINLIHRVNLYLHCVAAGRLMVMMLATVLDIVLQCGRPPGGGGSHRDHLLLRRHSHRSGHTALHREEGPYCVDFLTDRLSTPARLRLSMVTRLMGIALFFFASYYNFVDFSRDLC